MPIVRVEMFPGRTHAQKQELARAITEAVANIAHATADATIVIFEDVARENWAQAGSWPRTKTRGSARWDAACDRQILVRGINRRSDGEPGRAARDWCRGIDERVQTGVKRTY